MGSAIDISWKSKTIYYFSGNVFETLYNNIEILSYPIESELSEDFIKLLRALSVASYGMGAELADYLKTKEDLLIFIDLVRKGLDKFYIDHPDLPELSVENLEKFYTNLVEISKTFPN